MSSRSALDFLKKQFPNAGSIEFVMRFPMLHNGWEMDNVCYVVDVDSVPVFVHTDHGAFYYKSYEQCKSFLQEKVSEYEDAAKLTKDALALLK